jgi:D-alanyl-D-alanine carboxypeptidase
MKKFLFLGLFFIAMSSKAQHFQTRKMDSLFFLLEKHDKAMGSISVYHKGESLYKKTIGYADVDRKIKATVNTQYRTGSITKMFTATLVMQLIEEGKLSLETKLSKFYPELPNSDQITIQQLLQHESGFFNIIDTPNFKEWMVEKRSKDELLSKIKENGVIFSPGEKASYSNTNYIILTFIIEDIENKDFTKILKKRIIKPLRLKNTYYGKKTYPENFGSSSYEKKPGGWEKVPGIHLSIPLGAGGIVSTPEDLNKFINSLLDGKLVNEHSLAIMKKTNKKHAIGLNPISFIEGEEIIGHTGGMDAFKTLLVYLPNQDMSVAFTFNGVDYPFKNLVLGIFNILLNKEYDLPHLETKN